MRRYRVAIMACLLFATAAVASDAEEAAFAMQQGNAFPEQVNEAVEACEKAVQADPRNAEAYCALGVAYEKKGDFDRPIEYYKEAVSRSPGSVSALYELGVAYQTRERLADASRAFKDVLQVSPGHADAWQSLGEIYAAQGDFEKELECLAKAVRLNPHDTDAYYVSVLAHGRKIVYEKSIAAFKKAISLDRRSVSAYQLLARLHMKLSAIYEPEVNVDQAIGYLQAVSRLEPTSSRIYYQLGEASLMRGHYDAALAYLKKAQQLRYEDQTALHYLLGSVYRDTYNLNRALRHFRAALAFDPQNEDIQHQIQVLSGEKKKAERLARRTFTFEKGEQ